jgi:hypothetical protein
MWSIQVIPAFILAKKVTNQWAPGIYRAKALAGTVPFPQESAEQMIAPQSIGKISFPSIGERPRFWKFSKPPKEKTTLTTMVTVTTAKIVINEVFYCSSHKYRMKSPVNRNKTGSSGIQMATKKAPYPLG